MGPSLKGFASKKCKAEIPRSLSLVNARLLLSALYQSVGILQICLAAHGRPVSDVCLFTRLICSFEFNHYPSIG
uniref:Ovule protein n=1 Tax=Ascaris lumbricoides TaxID=6252 RepID=A0A0M3HUY3_ASCLU